MKKITLYGAPLSPFVRKVRLALNYKNVDYKLVTVIPFTDDQPADFKANSPLRKIPLLSTGDIWLPDSSVICAWLERSQPQPALIPDSADHAGRTLWFEEYADSHMFNVVGSHLFAEIVLAPLLFQREPVQADIDQAINTELPQIFDYLEGELSDHYLVGSTLSLADISVGSMFTTMQHCEHQCDPQKWPILSTYINRLTSSELFAPVIAEEKAILAAMKNA